MRNWLNKQYIFGLLLGLGLSAHAREIYVDAVHGSDLNTGTNWVAAKQTLSEAVSVASFGDRIWATNGTYNSGSMVTPGGTLSNRVVLNGISLRAADGCFPVIDGTDLMRCAFLTNGASVVGFRLSGGKADLSDDSSGNYLNNAGGGIFLNENCWLKNCMVENSEATRGGGVYCREGGLVISCTIRSNSASLYGAGIYFFKGGKAESCFLTQNSSSENGGGLYFYKGGTAINCTSRNNSASTTGNELDFVDGGTVQNCIAWNTNGAIDRAERATEIVYTCATDGVTNGVNHCFTNNPNFANAEDALATNSPCIDAGNNSYSGTFSEDRNGAVRVFNGTVDLGSFETPGVSRLVLRDYTFSAAYGSSSEITNRLYLQNFGNAAAEWSLDSPLPAWLSITPTEGVANGASATNEQSFCSLDFVADSSGLAAGTYVSTNLFSASSMEGGVTQVVTLVVSDSDLFIANYDFDATYNGTNEVQTLTLTNRGLAVADWSVSGSSAWLSILPTGGHLSGSSSTTLAFSANPQGLLPGTYLTTNIFDSTSMSGSFTQLVSMVINDSKLTISDLSFTASYRSGEGFVRYLSLTNSGVATATWSVKDLPDWLSITPTNGMVLGGKYTILKYVAKSDGLAPGTHLATNLFEASSMVSPVSQVVTFTITDCDYYVAPDGDDAAPGTNWVTAKKTIQAGVDAQNTPGRAIIVSNGTYMVYQQIEVSDDIVVKSLEGAEKTIVTGDDDTHGNCRCFLLEDGARLDGFTIMNGRADGATDEEQSGGGVLAFDSEIVNCILSSNWAKRVGGGLGAENTTVSNCYFVNNEVEGITFYGGAGGGASVSGGQVIDCTFKSNTAHYGAGLALSNSWVKVSSFKTNHAWTDGGAIFSNKSRGGEDLIFENNQADRNGGGFYFNDGGRLNRAAFTNNIAGNSGGAIYIADNSNSDSYDPAECRNVDLHQNHAGHYGGGAYLWHGGMITRSKITANTADANGGGIAFRLSGGVYRSEIYDNVAVTNGGGVYFSEGGYLRESVVSGNQAQRGAGIYHLSGGDTKNVLFTTNNASVRGGAIYCYKGGTLNGITTTKNSATEKGSGFYAYNSASNPTHTIQLENAIVWESTDPIYRSGNAIVLHHICSNESHTNEIDNLIQTDPHFLDAPNGNYRLSAASLCINAGTNTSSRSVDLDFKHRVMGSVMDLGAYEWDFNSDADADGLPDVWEMEYFGNATQATPNADPDGDDADNLTEFIAGTQPLDPSSYLRLISIQITTNSPADVLLKWEPSLAGRTYGISSTTNLLEGFQDRGVSTPYPSSKIIIHTAKPNEFYKVNVKLNN